MPALPTILFLLLFQAAALLANQQMLGRELSSGIKTNCPSNMFLCQSTQRCIPRSWLCDQEDDCQDGEDEKNCDHPQKRCGETEYECKNSQQQPGGGLTKMEERAPWLSHLASTGYAHTCIPGSWVCDGEVDCVEKDDEQNCAEKPKCNTTTHFECKSFDFSTATSCIPIEWVCDGQTDCMDMKDEQNCTTEQKQLKQECDKELEFKCASGQCIYKSWRCDGDNDCMDGSDERNCEENACTKVDKFKCKSTNFCIPDKWKCDGEPDCPDHSDETDCKGAANGREITCKKGEFQCVSRAQCISEFWRCDGDEDCFDGSDEQNCDKKKCKAKEWMCEDEKQCIEEGLRCDRTEDCADASDEKNCTTIVTPPQQNTCNSQLEFTCPDETPLRCIKYDELCNGKSSANDCAKRSICNTEIKICNGPAGACLSRKMASRGRLNYCAPGYKLIQTAGTTVSGVCQDIDECGENGACDQICINQPGTYRCECYHGYKLVGDSATAGSKVVTKKCRADGADPLLLLANRAAIRQFDIATNKYHPLIRNLESAVALDYWHANNTLVWSDVSKEQIVICAGISGELGGAKHTMLANINSHCAEGSANFTVIKDNVTTPDGLAVDWVHGLLFWTDTGHDSINVYDMNNKKRSVLINQHLDEPRAIAVDPSAGLIFWTDWGNKPRIERAGMNGDDRHIIVQGNAIKWPNGLALDILDKRVYWADAKAKQISTCDYWGQQVRVILHSHQHVRHPFSLAVFEERLYWTDWDQEGVLSMNKFHGKDVKQVLSGVSGPMTVRVYHQQAQPIHENKCLNHDCDHICLPRALYSKNSSQDEQRDMTGVPYSCACDSGFRIDLKNKSLCIQLDLPAAAITDSAIEAYESSGGSFTYLFGFLFLCVVVALGFAYYHRRPRHFAALHFENPIYRRTVEAELDADLENMGDNSLGPIAILPMGDRSGGQQTPHQAWPSEQPASGQQQLDAQQQQQSKLVLSVQEMDGGGAPAGLVDDVRNTDEYAYDQPLPSRQQQQKM